MKKIGSTITLIVATSCLMACSQPAQIGMSSTELSQWIGKNVSIQFRRDALGAAADLPVPPTTGSINGAQTTVAGKLLKVHASSILIGEEQHPKWIPREVILFVEMNP